ncbi:Short-chain dehydrogenase reductase SDR, partial [Modicella reniformis]
MHIQGKTFVVTGGSSGLGEATVRAIVGKGAKVIIFDINERGEAIAKELAGSVFWPGGTDVASEDSVLASIEKGVKEFGNISGVVNCGGILGMLQKIVSGNGEPQPLNFFEEVIRVNLIGTFNVC